MCDEDPIFTVTVMEKLEQDDLGWPRFGASRTVGFYRFRHDADMCIKHNNCDIWETCYNYAVMEKIYPGVYRGSADRTFYAYNIDKGVYEVIDEPDFMKHIGSISMG